MSRRRRESDDTTRRVVPRLDTGRRQRSPELDERNVRQRTLDPVQPASRNNHQARVALDYVMRPDGLISYVTLRPVRRAGDRFATVAIFRSFAARLRSEIYRNVRQQMVGWTDHRIRQMVRVSLFMYNSSNEGRTTARVDIDLMGVNEDALVEMFENATAAGSNTDLDIYDVEWKLWLNPASVIEGSSQIETTKEQDDDPDKMNIAGVIKYMKLKNDDGTVGCAAHAIAIGIDRKENPGRQKRHTDIKFTEFCKTLQDSLGFEDPKYATVFELQKFVYVYPIYRLVILQTAIHTPIIYTGREYTHNDDPKIDLTIFLYHDMRSKHFECIRAVTAFYKEVKKNKDQVVCYKCCTSIRSNSGNQKCQCGELEGEKRAPNKLTQCRDCEASYYKSHDPRKQHKCGQSTCKFCQLYYKSGEVGSHRCPLYVDPNSLLKIFDGDENPAMERLIDEAAAEKLAQKNADREARGWKPMKELSDTRHQLWVWDIESCFKPVPINTDVFKLNEDGSVNLEPGDLETTKMMKMAHIGNYVHCRNVFTDDEREFESLEDFIDFATSNNKGYNYFLAHNSSGYDSRLLFEVACKHLTCVPEPVFKGSRLMRLTLNNAVFQDSMLHLRDSLKKLGEGFQLTTPKGYFPHLFSTNKKPDDDFLNYNDRIPAKEFFDLTFTCKDEKDFKEFHVWWNEWNDGYNSDKEKYTWNYRDQRRFYCRNDTLMLKEIVYIYHTQIIESLKDYPYLTVSPWFFPTMAGHVHKLMLRHVHEGHYINQMSVEELKEYAQTTWCALEPEEHYFAHKALRGGMTNICKYIHEGRFHYQDIQSAYPSVQLDAENLYPVGSPIIEVHDDESYPCRFCYASRRCTHTLEQKLDIESKHRQNKLKIRTVNPSNLHDYCMSFFGIITVDITPPKNLYHPLIQGYDHIKKKVIGTLEPIVKETLTSVMLIEAIKIGYVVTKIYRADRYYAAESKWRNGLLGDMYVAKMRNAGKVKEKDQQRMRDTFMTKYKIDLGDFETYEKNAVKKQVAKGPITAAWGKHAESVDHGQSVMFKQSNNDGMDFYRELLLNKSSLSNVRSIGNNMLYDYKENRQMKRPELHKTYLPAAVFVTAYGRIKLWRKLVELDPPGTPKDKLRVIMYDTDSIVYECHSCTDHECHKQERECAGHIEKGDCLGDWEYEDIETKNEGLVKFYAIGPKSYSLVCGNGKTKMKLKGAVIKHSHFKIITPEIMKELVLSKAEGAVSKVATLPQMSFDYKLGYGEESMTTRYFKKIIQFHVKDVKGEFSWDDYRGYPEGFKVE